MNRFFEKVKKNLHDLLYRNFVTEHLIPVKNQIILESYPDFADNTYSLYLEMLKNNYQKKYKIIWLVREDTINDNFKRDDISYLNINKRGFFHRLKIHYLLNSSKFIITCNAFYKKKTKKQVTIFLDHGQPLKDCSKLETDYKDADLTLSSSEFFNEKKSLCLNIDPDKFAILQPPRNDDMFDCDKDIKKIMGYDDKKIVLWLPTFRKHMDKKRIDSSFEMPLGVPIIYKIEDLEKLNKYLKKRNIILVLKPHFAADLDDIKAGTYSNFKIIYNKDLDDKNITLYELLGKTDALLTDYSSVYYDYLITKKPIGITLDDFESYKKETGFAYDFKEVIKGHYIYNMNDLYDFFDNLSNDIDESKKERMKILEKLGFDTTGNYSKKVFDYLVDKFNF